MQHGKAREDKYTASNAVNWGILLPSAPCPSLQHNARQRSVTLVIAIEKPALSARSEREAAQQHWIVVTHSNMRLVLLSMCRGSCLPRIVASLKQIYFM